MLATEITSDTGLLSAEQIDPELADVLYGQRAHELITFFYRRTRNPDAAAELLAETFASASVHRRHNSELSATDAAWLRNIAKLELSRYFRKLRVETNTVQRIGMIIPRLTDAEVAMLDDEAFDARSNRLGASA